MAGRKKLAPRNFTASHSCKCVSQTTSSVRCPGSEGQEHRSVPSMFLRISMKNGVTTASWDSPLARWIWPSNIGILKGQLVQSRSRFIRYPYVFLVTFLVGNVLGIFGAASVSVQLVIQWLLLNLADRVDELQSKIQEEIDDVVGRDRPPSWEDSKRMPLTLATIWETFRWRTPVPLNLPRGVEENTYFRGYLLPEDSVVMANIWAVHMDPALWENPEEFNPGRFLSKDVTGLVDKPEYLIPFSIGSRKCPGETLATVEIFLYLTGIMQKFTVLPEEGKAIDMTCRSLLLCMPEPQKLRFVAR